MTIHLAPVDRMPWGEFVYGRTRRLNIRAVADFGAKHIGAGLNRTSLSDTFDLDEPPTEGLPAVRAWLVLTFAGENAAEWGVPDDVLPAAIDVAELRRRIEEARPTTQWDDSASDLAFRAA